MSKIDLMWDQLIEQGFELLQDDNSIRSDLAEILASASGDELEAAKELEAAIAEWDAAELEADSEMNPEAMAA